MSVNRSSTRHGGYKETLGGRQLQPHGKAGRAGDDKQNSATWLFTQMGTSSSFILGKPWGLGRSATARTIHRSASDITQTV